MFLLQHGPTLAFTDIRYLLIALAGGLLGLVCGSNPGRKLGSLRILVDAAALGFSGRWLEQGTKLRKGLNGEPYAGVATIVSVLFVISDRLSGNTKLSTSIGIAAGFMIRVLALRFQCKTKAAR
jgi:uncharacterized membrane protein YeiH